MNRPRRGPSEREAFVFAGVLAIFVIVAFVGWYRIYSELDRAFTVQRQVEAAQRSLDDALRIQADEESGLEEFLATGQSDFLDAYLATTDRFHAALDHLLADAAPLGIVDLPQIVADMRHQHDVWERDIAVPLRHNPHDSRAITLRAYGKEIDQQIESDRGSLRTLLDIRLTSAQNSLKYNTNLTLAASLVLSWLTFVIGIVALSSRARMQARIERERSIIETLQGAFRVGWDELPGSRIGTAYISATADAAVGGDLFDVRRLDDARGLLVVADVSGKGIEAAVNTAFVKYSIQTLARTMSDPAEILDTFNRVFLETIRDPGLFVVTFVGVLDMRALTLSYASAGHAGAFLRRGGSVEQLDVTGPIIGLEKASRFERREIALKPNDLLVLATDGLTEARDRSGAMLEDQGAMRLVRDSSSDPQTCADELVAAIRRRSGGRLGDDLALLVVRVEGKPARAKGSSKDAAA